MSGEPTAQFSSAWLAQREPYDRASRSKALARAFLEALPRDARVADLASGTGSNACYLSRLGRGDLRWDLVDADPKLLSVARDRLHRSDTRRIDLARPRRSLGLDRYHGITASALCDLVSGAWLDALISDAARGGLPLLFALSVDGRVVFSPRDPWDQAILKDFSRDQRRDKGFGPALGPCGPRRLAAMLRTHGYRLRAARSDWRLGAGDDAMLHALVAGFADVAGKNGSAARDEIAAWMRLREGQISAGRLALTIGHVDLFADHRPVLARASRAVTLP